MSDEVLTIYLAKIKKFIGIADGITVHDDELTFWIRAAVETMTNTAGVPVSVFTTDEDGNVDNRALAAVFWYVRANFGNDRSDTNRAYTQYKHKVRELQAEEGGVWDPEEGDS